MLAGYLCPKCTVPGECKVDGYCGQKETWLFVIDWYLGARVVTYTGGSAERIGERQFYVEQFVCVQIESEPKWISHAIHPIIIWLIEILVWFKSCSNGTWFRCCVRARCRRRRELRRRWTSLRPAGCSVICSTSTRFPASRNSIWPRPCCYWVRLRRSPTGPSRPRQSRNNFATFQITRKIQLDFEFNFQSFSSNFNSCEPLNVYDKLPKSH